MRSFVISAVVLAAVSAGYVFSANTPAIGVAVTVGSFMLNDAQTSGNATIFDGSTVQAGVNAAQVRLNGGAQVSLMQESKGRLFADHVDLEKGSARVSGYSLTADGLKVDASGASAASVTMHGKTLEVASIYGDVKVFNASGMNVANLLPGRALNLTPQEAGAAAPSQLVGCVAKKDNNFFLMDDTSNVTVQLRGGMMLRENHRYQVNGTMIPNGAPVSPATQVLNVVGQKDLNKTCKGAAVLAGGAAAGAAGAGAAAGGAAAGAAAGAAVGVSTTAIVVGGVAAAAVAGVGGAAAAGAINGGCTPVSPSTTC